MSEKSRITSADQRIPSGKSKEFLCLETPWKHLSVFSPRGGGERAAGMQGELDSKDYLDRA